MLTQSLVCLLLGAATGREIGAGCYEHVDPATFQSYVRAPIQSAEVLPAQLDWRNVNESSFVTPIRNQFLPMWCGSCWAQAATEMLSDRLKILRFKSGQRGADIELSPQPLLDCAADVGTCKSGNDYLALEWIKQHGITDRTCAPYTASQGACLNETSFCKICYNDGSCRPLRNATRYFVDEYDFFPHWQDDPRKNAPLMMQEISARGPITCSIYDMVGEFSCYKDGVIDVPLPSGVSANATTHVITLVGWGEGGDGGEPYWIGKNSAGIHWGDEGFFRIARGKNTLNVERYCRWATLHWPAVSLDRVCVDSPPLVTDDVSARHSRDKTLTLQV